MRIELHPPVVPIPKDLAEVQDGFRRIIEHLWMEYHLLSLLLNGQVNFGDGSSLDNVAGRWITYTTSENEDSIQHDLGAIPTGFFVMNPPEFGVINRGSTPWTTTHLYLICGEPNQTVTIFVLPPPLQTA